MKILILLFIFTASASAGWVKQSEITGAGAKNVYLKKKYCGSDCVKIPTGYNKNYYDLEDEYIDDPQKPIWATRSMIESCSGEDACKALALSKMQKTPVDCVADDTRLDCQSQKCTDYRTSFYNAEYSEVWCNKISGFEKKLSGRKILSRNESKKTQFETTEAAKKADEMAMAAASKALDCGKKVISRMLLQNKPKSLSKAQVRNLVKTYKDIKNLLDTGSLESAREDILAVTLNPPIVTQADKDALVAELDACK